MPDRTAFKHWMLMLMPVTFSPQLLQAAAKAKSARVNSAPPCTVSMPLKCRGSTISRAVARAGPHLDQLHAVLGRKSIVGEELPDSLELLGGRGVARHGGLLVSSALHDHCRARGQVA